MTAEQWRDLLGHDVVLLGWPRGSKGTPKKWGHLTAASMTPAYLKKLERGNIGVALGRVSGGLIAVDVDVDTLVSAYLAANPDWKDTLQTHGARGRVFWMRMAGEYPAKTIKLKTHAGEDVGEWRAGRNSQSIIHGIHPNGNPYQIVNLAKSLMVDFASIVWPTQISNPPSLADSLPLNTNGSDNVTQLHSYTVTQLHSYTCGSVVAHALSQLVHCAIPTKEGTNHNHLWTLARIVKGLERETGSKATHEKLNEIFNCWHSRALPYLKPDQTRDQYLLEFMQAYSNAKLPLGETGITEAWKQAQQKPFPPEAIAAFTDDKFRLIVAFCRELQINAGDKPFYLSCRTLAKLLEKETHMTCSRYLTALRVMGFIEEISKGTIGPNGTASCYRYKGGTN